MLEGTVEFFLKELGAALDDRTLALDADGTLVRARAMSVLNASQTKIMRALLDMGVREQVFARKATLAADSSDDDVSILPYRTLAVLSVEDGNDNPYVSVFSRKRLRDIGFIVERRASTTGSNYNPVLRWWNMDRPSTVYAWVIEEPVRLSYGDGTYAATTVTLEASPDLGETITNDDYYNGAEIAVVDGTYLGQIREISDYVGSTRACTIATWTNTPTASDNYSLLSSLPRVTWDAIVYEAAMRVAMVDARWWDQHGVGLANLRRQREASLLEAFRVLAKPVRGEAVTPRRATYWIT